MKPRFSGVSFVVYPVRDMARARLFYDSVLGLKETANWEDKWIEFDVGSATLAITSFMDGVVPAHAAAVALETDDLDKVAAHLKQQGVKFLMEPADTGVCHFARFEDSEGNQLILHEKHGKPSV
ncbi:MAG: VOC family protein [Opitutaceae bacterium]|nr:VOC family protein [Opitutaceae bacterium]